MKNIHVLLTDKPSRILKNGTNLLLAYVPKNYTFFGNSVNVCIYITADEEIKEGVDQWYLDKVLNKPYNSGGAQYSSKQDVIILTTDPDLIKDGVQAIDDEFLEWFVKNPSCEEVVVEKEKEILGEVSGTIYFDFKYKIIIPKEEPKQESLEAAAKNNALLEIEKYEPTKERFKLACKNSFIRGYKLHNNELIGLLKQTTEYEVSQKFRDKINEYLK